MFEIYHAMKIGMRNLIDEALVTKRYACIIRYATRVATDCLQLHADVFFGKNSSSPPGAHAPRHAPACSLRQRRWFHSNIHTSLGRRSSTSPITFTNAEHIDFCPSWRGIATANDLDSDVDT